MGNRERVNKLLMGLGHTFNGYTKEEWVYHMGCELGNLLAGEYPDDGVALPYIVRVVLDEFEGLVTQNRQMEYAGEEWLAKVPDEMVQRWALLRGAPRWKEGA